VIQEEKSFDNVVTKIELFESTNTKALRMVIKKDKLLAVNFTLIQCLND